MGHTNDEFAIAYVRQPIDIFFQFVSNFPFVQIIFLEIPCYSIEEYNRYLKVADPESFHEKDLILIERIGIINDYIWDANKIPGFNTPRFKRDLIKYRKSEGENQP